MPNSSTTIQELGVGGEQDKIKWEGLNTSIKDPRFLHLGQSYDEVNWITGRDGDNIQLRRGSLLLGKTRRTTGNVTGLGVGVMGNTQVPLFSANQSVYYYNASTGDTQEVNTSNILPLVASGEDVTFIPYQNLAGSFVYFTSPHSGAYKIPVANPGDVVNQNVTSYRFVYARADQNRLWGVGRYGTNFAPDLTSTYISNVDKSTYSAYPTPTINESIGTGDGTTTTFVGAITVTSPNTAFGVLVGGAISTGTTITAITETSAILQITSAGNTIPAGGFAMALGVTSTGDPINGNLLTCTVPASSTPQFTSTAPVNTISYGSGGTLYPIELFVDQGQGILVSNLGGTGTINYATGAISVTFNTAPVAGVAIIANNFLENATSGGIWDFTFAATDPSIGQAYQFAESAGGSALGIAGFQGVEYVFHTLKSWIVGLPTDTTSTYSDATNSEYWSHIGIPYRLAQYPTGDGVIYLDNTNPSVPKFSELQIPPGSTSLTVVPQWISQDLDLSVYSFTKCVVYRWGEYNILACEGSLNGIPNGYNSVFFIQNIYSNQWNLLDYSVSSLDEYLGALISGDSLSPNLETLFSGTDDDANIIDNHWNSGYTDFGFNGMKKTRYVTVEGLIGRGQQIQVAISLDQGEYVPVFTINGTGNYVNNASPVACGSNTLGSQVLGGGAATLYGNTFLIDIPIFTDFFETISVQFQGMNVGWAQINRFAFKSTSIKRIRLSPYNDATT